MNMDNIPLALFALLRPFASGKLRHKELKQNYEVSVISECPTWYSLNHIFAHLSICYYTKLSKHICWGSERCPLHPKKPEGTTYSQKSSFVSPKSCIVHFKTHNNKKKDIIMAHLPLSLVKLTKYNIKTPNIHFKQSSCDEELIILIND